MAKPRGIIRYTGTMGGVSCYRDSRNGYIMRGAGGPSAEQIASLDSCRAVRGNIAEFGAASPVASRLLQALRPLRGSADMRLYSRLVSALQAAIKQDTLHQPGERRLHPGNIGQFGPVGLNKKTAADRAFHSLVPFSINDGQMLVSLSCHMPQQIESATHFKISSALVQVYPHPVSGYLVHLRETEYLPVNAELLPGPHSFIHEGAHPDAMLVYGAAIRYYMLVNGGYYSVPGHRLNTGFVRGIGQRWPLTGSKINIA